MCKVLITHQCVPFLVGVLHYCMYTDMYISDCRYAVAYTSSTQSLVLEGGEGGLRCKGLCGHAAPSASFHPPWLRAVYVPEFVLSVQR